MRRIALHRLSPPLCTVVLAAGLACCAPPEPTADEAAAGPDAAAEAAPAATPDSAQALLAPIPPRFETLTVADGLSANSVRRVLQDRQGFLWVATYDGLSRYDGATFTEFHHDPGDPHSLGDDITSRLFEARDGHLWVGTESGLDRYDPVTETFAHFRHNPDDSTTIGKGPVAAIAEDAGGALWVGTWSGGLNRYDPETATFAHFRHDPDDPASLPHDNVYALAPDPDGGLWVGTAAGVVRIVAPAHDAAALSRVDFDMTSTFGGGIIAYALRLDRTGLLWVGTSDMGLLRYDPATGATRHYPPGPGGPGHPWVLSIFEDREGALWVGTAGGGLHRYDAGRDAFERFGHDPADPTSLADHHVRDVFEDRTGVLWVGTGRGLSRRLPLSRVVAQERHRPGDPASLSSDDVTAFVEDAAGALWVGTWGGGLNRRDPDTGAFERVPLPYEGALARNVDNIVSLAADPDGTVWVSTMGGLFRHLGTGRSELFMAVDSAGSTFPIRAPGPLKVPRTGRLWVGTQYGLYDVDVTSRRAVEYKPAPPNPRSNINQWVHTILAEPDGPLWVSVDPTALYRFNPEEETFTDVRPTFGGGAPVGYVTSLLRARSGALWVGTTSGLERIDADGRGQRYGRADGLPNTTIHGLLEDPAGHIWAATNRGLSRFDPLTEAFQSYGTRDGLQGDIANEGAFYQSPSTGRFYIGGDLGFNAFDPSALPPEPPPPAPVLTGLRLSGTPVPIADERSPLRRALSMTEALRLQYDDRVVTFAFASLDFRAPYAHRYAVRLDGFDDDWREVGEEQEATFTNLSPGRYTFRVRAAGRDGVWGDETALGVTVVPPWWRAWWAYLGYTLLAVGLLAAAYQARRRRHELRHRLEMEHLEAEKLRELDHARSRFFANVSHEFRTPLTLTLGPLDDLKAGLHGPLSAPMAAQVDLARRNAARVLDLINQILDVARLEAGRTPLRAQPLDLGAFVEAVAQPFREGAARKAITFEVDGPATPVEVYADPGQFEKVVANLLSNAVKFTPEGGTVRVTVAAADGAARVAVRDSGPGIPAADLPHVFDRFYQVGGAEQTRLGTGIGLALANEVVDLHGGTLAVESEEGFGSTFTVTLPLGRTHLTPEQVVEGDAPWAPTETLPARPTEPRGDRDTDGTGDADENAAADEASADADVTTVLVVEDHPEVRAYVRRHLTEGEPAYRVLEAADGAAGLALARERLPDLILSDVMMPKLDGLGLCRALKSDPETDFIPVVLLTAKAAPEDRLEGLGELADDYLTKPFDPAELRARVANLIAMRTRLRERFRHDGGATAGDGASAPASPATASVADVSAADAAFLARVHEAVDAHLSDERFNVERLAEAVGVSRGHLHRQLKALTEQAPSDLIRATRLEQAAHLLETQAGTVSEVGYAVGFKSVAHFSNAFARHFGCRPSAYGAGQKTA